MVTVPHIEPQVPPLFQDPTVLMMPDWLRPHARGRAEHFREALAKSFGDAAREIEWCEVYEISEYGRALDEKVKAKLFG